MKAFKTWTYFTLILLATNLIFSCSVSKNTDKPLGNPFPIVDIEATSMLPLSIYECVSIVIEGDTINIDQIMCSDSVQFNQLFSGIDVNGLCIECRYEGTTWYSVSIGSEGEFENLEVKKEVASCFETTTAQIEEILNKTRTIEKEYFNTELLFYHKFSIDKNEN